MLVGRAVHAHVSFALGPGGGHEHVSMVVIEGLGARTRRKGVIFDAVADFHFVECTLTLTSCAGMLRRIFAP